VRGLDAALLPTNCVVVERLVCKDLALRIHHACCKVARHVQDNHPWTRAQLCHHLAQADLGSDCVTVDVVVVVAVLAPVAVAKAPSFKKAFPKDESQSRRLTRRATHGQVLSVLALVVAILVLTATATATAIAIASATATATSDSDTNSSNGGGQHAAARPIGRASLRDVLRARVLLVFVFVAALGGGREGRRGERVVTIVIAALAALATLTARAGRTPGLPRLLVVLTDREGGTPGGHQPEVPPVPVAAVVFSALRRGVLADEAHAAL
jgi:hypothetical protein